MRRVAVLGLLAAAGCNQILGLGPVELYTPPDVTIPPDGPRVRFTWQITKTKDTGYWDTALDYAPLVPSPQVRLGALDGPLLAATYSAEGTIAYPAELAGQPWRLVYTLEDGLLHEVHWTPPEGDLLGHIVEPLFGRLPRLPAPTNSGYRISPIGAPGQHALTRVFTTGVWTEAVFSGTSAGATFDFNFDTRAVSLSGPRGTPAKAKLDHAMLADFKNVSVPPPGISCRASTGTATFAVPDLVADTFTPPETPPTWVTADKQVRLNLGGPTQIDARLAALLGARAGGADLLRMQYGYTPSALVFAFSRPRPASALDFFLPGPLVLALANCTFQPGTMVFQTEVFADSPALYDRFPRVVHVEVVNQRTLGLLSLTSGFSAVVTSNDDSFTSDFLVAAPIGIRLTRGGAQIADLENSADGTPLTPGDGGIELEFDVEARPNLATDYFDITLYSIEGSSLVLQRVYTVTGRRLAIDPAFLLPDTEYVFEIRAYRGRPDIARADFAISTYPQYSATIFTRTFKTPP